MFERFSCFIYISPLFATISLLYVHIYLIATANDNKTMDTLNHYHRHRLTDQAKINLYGQTL